ncbi:MAG: hypothetical protein MUF62_10830 [Chitinophagaceae bacterium]|nr:hypothetical protein [Chitinophagaceae bacterium]
MAKSILREQLKARLDEADNRTLQLVQVLLDHDTGSDWWHELPTEVQQSIDRGLAESKAQKGIAHQDVQSMLAVWHTK